MGFLDDLVDSAATKLGGSLFGGDDGDDGDGGGGLWDRASQWLGGDDNGADGEGSDGGSFWDTAKSFISGDGDDSEGDGGDSFWGGTIGKLVDQVSGDGEGEGWFSGAVDRVRSFLPEDVTGAAESLFGQGAGAARSWAGSLLEDASGAIPDWAGPLVSSAAGSSFGQDGPGAWLDRGLGALQDAAEPYTSGLNDPAPAGARQDAPDAPDANYDDMVLGTSAAAGSDVRTTEYDPQDRYNDGVPGTEPAGSIDDPTFPDDVEPAPVVMDEPDVEPEPMDDFSQDMDALDDVGSSMTDDMFEGLSE